MRIDVAYIIKGNERLATYTALEEGFREDLGGPVVFISHEGGRSAWGREEHLFKVKLLYLIYLNYQFDYIPFLQTSPISVEFFDAWWEILRSDETPIQEDWLRDNVDEQIRSRIAPTGNELVDRTMKELERFSSNLYLESNLRDYPTFRVYLNHDVIGRLRNVTWQLQAMEGDWDGTKNLAGTEFKKAIMEGEMYDVTIEGSSFAPAQMSIVNGKAKLFIKPKA